jgi:integrase
LRSIFELAVRGEGDPNESGRDSLHPQVREEGDRPAMTTDEAETAVGAVEFRERVVLQLAIFGGLRPSEMPELRPHHVARTKTPLKSSSGSIAVEIDDSKNGESRSVAIPPRTAALLSEWLDTAINPNPDA